MAPYSVKTQGNLRRPPRPDFDVAICDIKAACSAAESRDVIALLHQHQHQRVLRTADHAGRAMRYVEVTLEDIALANELAHEVLGRTLDELPPQTRRLLGLLVGMVEQHCAEHELRRADYRFSRRRVREHTRWGDTQLKIHLARLVELEYLIVHRGGRGQSFEYELVFDGKADADVRHASGLIDVDALKRDYDAERSGSEDAQSGAGRASAGTPSAAQNMAHPHHRMVRTAKTHRCARASDPHRTSRRRSGASP